MLGRSAACRGGRLRALEVHRASVSSIGWAPPDRVRVVPWSWCVRAPSVPRPDPAGAPRPAGSGRVGSRRCSCIPRSPTRTRTTWCCSRPSRRSWSRCPAARLRARRREPVRSRPEVARADRRSGSRGQGGADPAGSPSTEMDVATAEPTAVVIPSRYEGFGLPALEAMSRGVPLVVSERRFPAGGRRRHEVSCAPRWRPVDRRTTCRVGPLRW